MRLTVPSRYIPPSFSATQKKKQAAMLLTSQRLYKQGRYYTRRKIPSYPAKTSRHVVAARRIYGLDSIAPGPELAAKTGCPVPALRQIVKKGEGAYYSSGSRPNQTPQSWGVARLASALTGGKAAAVDYSILCKCDHTKKAFQLAVRARRKYGHGQSKTKKTTVII